MSHPPKGKITRAPSDADFDQAIMVFAVALFVFLLSIWLVWTNGQAAATAYMLDKKQTTTTGVVLLWQGKHSNSKSIEGYGFKDKKGKIWTKHKPSIFDYSTVSTISETLNKYRKADIAKLLRDKRDKTGNLNKYRSYEDIIVYFHPEYPRFFAIAAERRALTMGFNLTIAGLIGLILSLLLGFYSVRKYKRLKAIAAYY